MQQHVGPAKDFHNALSLKGWFVFILLFLFCFVWLHFIFLNFVCLTLVHFVPFHLIPIHFILPRQLDDWNLDCRLLQDDQKESGLLIVLSGALKQFDFRRQPRSHAATGVEAVHITIRLLQKLSSQGVDSQFMYIWSRIKAFNSWSQSLWPSAYMCFCAQVVVFSHPWMIIRRWVSELYWHVVLQLQCSNVSVQTRLYLGCEVAYELERRCHMVMLEHTILSSAFAAYM